MCNYMLSVVILQPGQISQDSKRSSGSMFRSRTQNQHNTDEDMVTTVDNSLTSDDCSDHTLHPQKTRPSPNISLNTLSLSSDSSV